MLGFAADHYCFEKSTCRFIADGRENAKQVYTFDLKDQPYVLRFVKAPLPYIHQTKAEMDWLSYLADKGVSVPFPLKTKEELLAVSAAENGETFILSAFQMAKGRYWDKNDPCLWNTSVFYNWGKVVGDMHRFTKDYRPANDADMRGAFHIRGMISENIKNFPSINSIVEDLLAEIESLPKDRDSYGLIHNDLHPGNFSIDGTRISLFDFDDCAYSWYALDIGNALYLALWLGRKNDTGTDFTNDIIQYFLKGYLSANHLNDFWLSKIPSFMMACKIALFSLGCDCENPGHAFTEDCQKEQAHHIANGILFAGCTVENPPFRNGGSITR